MQMAFHEPYGSHYLSKYESELPVILHPLIIGKDIVLCMPEVNKVLRNVYQVLSQANYYLSKHRITSRRFTGAQLIRIKMLGILGHEAKVCSYILQRHAEKIFNSFDMTGDCRKSEALKWLDPVLLDQKNIDESNGRSVDPVDNTPGIPATVNVFKMGEELIVCTPDIQKVLQIKFNTGSTTGYYYAKLGIVPYKFEKLEHLHKVKELGIIKSSAIHCTYVLKQDAIKVLEACGMNSQYTDENIKFLDVIDLGEAPERLSWPLAENEIKQENSRYSPLSTNRSCFSPDSHASSSKRSISDEDDEFRNISHDDMTVHVFIVDNREVVCMPDIHKIVQNIHGNSIQVNYYFNKLKVQKKRFCFAHLRELKARNILQNNATYCTYVPREDAEKLFQIHFLVDDPKLNDIKWEKPVNLDHKLSDQHNEDSNDNDSNQQPVDQLVTVHSFSVDGTVVVTTPDVHRIVDFLEEQSASLDYHFRKLGICKYRFTYSQLHQLRRLNVIKRPTVCTFVSRKDVSRLLKMYETERNKVKIKSIKFLPPVVLVPGSAPAKFKVEKQDSPPSNISPNSIGRSFSDSFIKPRGPSPLSPFYNESNISDTVMPRRPLEGLNGEPSLIVDNRENLMGGREILIEPRDMMANNRDSFIPNGDSIMSPTSRAMKQLQVMHPAIDCPIVIPNGDYDPMKEYNPINGNGKRLYEEDSGPNKRMRIPNDAPYQSLLNDIRRKEDELRLLHDAYQKEIEMEREKRLREEMKNEELIRVHQKELEKCQNSLKTRDEELKQALDEAKEEREKNEKLEEEITKLKGDSAVTTEQS